MKTKCLLVALAILAGVQHTFAQGTMFTYQGRLNDPSGSCTGIYDLRFAIYDAATNGTIFGAGTIAATPVTNGLFTVALDFGNVFDGGARWLELGVRSQGGANAATNGAIWNGIATNKAGAWSPTNILTETSSGTPVSVTVQDNATNSTNRFMRMRVTSP